MKRYSIRLTFALILLLACAGASHAVFPVADGTLVFKMNQGWLDGQTAWYIATDTNDIRFATTLRLMLSPLLASAEGAVPVVLIVRNPASTQGPIFEAGPGDPTYAGIVDVKYVDWNPGFPAEPITSTLQAALLEFIGAITITDPGVILDAPIMAVGPLGGPWAPASPGRYRIPQGKVDPNYTITKQIKLPAFSVYCQDFITNQIVVRKLIIPDVSDPDLAALLGANVAPGLLAVDPANRQPFWFMLDPKPVNQFPVVRSCPSLFGLDPTNTGYTPIMQYFVLVRHIPVSTVVNNADYLVDLLNNVLLTPLLSNVRINAPVALFLPPPPPPRP